MKRVASREWRVGVAVLVFVAVAAQAQVNTARVAMDARVIDRVAEASKRDLPRDLLRRIVAEDVDLLRGKRADGTYQYASFERLEAGRITKSESVQPTSKDDGIERVEIQGDFVYRLIIDSPSRRMLVTKNRPLFVDRVEIEYVPLNGSAKKFQTVKVEADLPPGSVRPIDLEEIARQATVRVFARADKEAGYGNVNLTLLQAKVYDNPESPYADAVSSMKAIQRNIDNYDIPSIRSMAQRVADRLAPQAGTPATRTMDVVATAPPASAPATKLESTPSVEIYLELQAIEDMLTGSDGERREGLDRLHQLVRRLRTQR